MVARSDVVASLRPDRWPLVIWWPLVVWWPLVIWWPFLMWWRLCALAVGPCSAPVGAFLLRPLAHLCLFFVSRLFVPYVFALAFLLTRALSLSLSLLLALFFFSANKEKRKQCYGEKVTIVKSIIALEVF